MNNICIRVDGDNYIGSGHIYRCLNLASYINNSKIEFICKNISINLVNLIESKYKLNLLEKNNKLKITIDKNTWLNDSEIDDVEKTINIIKNKNFDWIIIDHYGISDIWENKIKDYIKNIFVIDDYYNRKHNCNYLLNQLCNNTELYNNLLNKNCKLLHGNEYFLLDKKYLNIINLNNNDKLTRINIFMGGIDNTNETEKIIKKCNIINKKLNNAIIFDVVVGLGNNNKKKIEILCKEFKNFNYYYNIDNFSELLLKSDLSIGSAGKTIFEKCILELPSLLICFDLSQQIILQDIINLNIFNYIGTINENYLDNLEAKIMYYYNYPYKLKEIKKNCKKFFNIENLKKFNININNIFNKNN